MKIQPRLIMIRYPKLAASNGRAMTEDEDFKDLLVTLEWAVGLPLTPEQRSQIKDLCCRLARVKPGVPSDRLREEAEKKREAIARAESAEKRANELEAALRNRREEWVFRRKTAR